MIDLLFQIGVSNVVIALLLAGMALVVEVTGKRPQLAHLLWLLVFIKLLTPAFLTVPLDFFTLQPDTTTVVVQQLSVESLAVLGIPELGSGVRTLPSKFSFEAALVSALPWLAGIWLLGCVVVLTVSLMRVYRFNRVLRTASQAAPSELQTIVVELAEQLGLRAGPVVCLTSAAISPLVWWLGGKVRIVIPKTVYDELDSQQLRWILAHELAHVRRNDHLVRWVEWLACVCWCWNPLVWWARHHLRTNEELCCDALVLRSFNPLPQTYAQALLTAIECLACPVIRPPAVASEINSGGVLERRLKMIVSTPTTKTPIWVLGAIVLGSLIVLPISFGLGGSPADTAIAATEGPGADGCGHDGDGICAGSYWIADSTYGAMIGELLEAGIASEDIKPVLATVCILGDEIAHQPEATSHEPWLSERHAITPDLTCEQLALIREMAQRLAVQSLKIDPAGDLEFHWDRENVSDNDTELAREYLDPAIADHRSHQLKSAIENGELTQEEADARFVDLSKQASQEDKPLSAEHAKQESLADYYLRLGVDEHEFDRLVTALTEGGTTREQLEGELSAILRIASLIQQQGDEYALDEGMHEYLTGQLGLSALQLRVVLDISRKFASLLPDMQRAPPHGVTYFVRVTARADGRLIHESEMNLHVPFSALAFCSTPRQDEFGAEYQEPTSVVHFLSNERRLDDEPLAPEIAAVLENAVRIPMGAFVVDAWIPEAEQIKVMAWQALVAEPSFPSGDEPAKDVWEYCGEGSVENRPAPVE